MKSILALLLGLLAIAARAQIDQSLILVTSDHHNAEIRQVLKDLFGKVEVSFSMDADIKGKLSLHLTKMPFESALQTVLKSCGLTYRSGGGVYQIIRREISPEEQKWIEAHPESQIQTTGLPDDITPALKAKNQMATDLLWRILSKSGKPFVIGSGIHTSITADLPEQPLSETLAHIALASHSALIYRQGVWILSGSAEVRIPNQDPQPTCSHT